MPKPGDVFVDFESQTVKYDDGAEEREILDTRHGPLIYASGPPWKCKPDTGADMTARIQSAFNEAPLGCTLVFDPGTYRISNTTHLSRMINLMVSGVVFDLGANTPATTFAPGIPENHDGASYLAIAAREAGTLTTRAAMIWGISGANRPSRNLIIGNLKITRTASADTAAARLHCGLLMLAPFECRISEIECENFREGVVEMGGTAEGAAYNIIGNIKTTNCRYPLTLYTNRATGAGWANQNIISSGRLFVTSAIRGEASWNEAQWEPIRLLWESGGTSPSAPNGNYFGPLTIEGAYGRKVRCEGRFNEFEWLRYEDVHAAGTPDITIGEVSRTNTQFSGNFFVGGDSLGSIVALNNIEFLSSGGGNGVNHANTFLGGRSNVNATRVDAGDVKLTAHRFQTTSATAAVIGVNTASAQEVLRLHNIFAALSAQGALEFLDTGEVSRNAFGMETASPYDLAVQNGFKIAGVLRVRLDGTIDAIVTNPQSTGDVFWNVAGGQLILYSSSASGNDVLVIGDSSRDARLIIKAQEALGSGITYLDVLKFYDDDATPTYMNAIGLHPSSNLGASRPLLIEKGIWINEMLADADTRISSDTDTNCFYLDASALSGAGAVGIGTATPDSKLHVVGKIHGTDELELDGALNHDGTTVGFYGTAPVTIPTVTGSRVANPALASLLTALAGLGLIVDSTTV